MEGFETLSNKNLEIQVSNNILHSNNIQAVMWICRLLTICQTRQRIDRRLFCVWLQDFGVPGDLTSLATPIDTLVQSYASVIPHQNGN